MNRDFPKAAISLRQAPTDRAPTMPVMGNSMVATSFNDTMTDHARVQVGHAPLQYGQGKPSVTIAERLEKLEARNAALETENAGLEERIAALEFAAEIGCDQEPNAPQTTTGEIDGA
jgi:hypothetical protein